MSDDTPPSLNEIIKNESLSSEAKVKKITSNEATLSAVKKCFDQSHPNSKFRSKIVKLTFCPLEPLSSDVYEEFSSSKVQPEAVKELLSDFLKVERIKQINENEFEIELKDRTEAELVLVGFDGIELEELNLKLSVTEVKMKIKSKLRNKKFSKAYLGNLNKLSFPRKSSHMGETKRKDSMRNQQNAMIKPQMMNMMPAMGKFRNGSFNGNMLPMHGFSNKNMDFMQMQYLASFGMMNQRGKNGLGKSKQIGREMKAKVRYAENEKLLPGIVLISPGKNKPNTNKFTCRYNVMIENDKNFQVAKKIIGSKGCNMKSIIDSVPQQYPNFNQKRSKQDALKLRLRGKGSGFKEGPDQRESDEPLHLCISAKCESVYLDSCKRVERLLNKIYEDYLTHLEKSANKDDVHRLQAPKKFRFQKYEGNAHMFK